MSRTVAISPNPLDPFPRVELGHVPTPLERLPRLSEMHGVRLYVKRDDCTGLAFGGNKVRQLEFYLGDALAKDCDTVLSTGAVQSNYMRLLAAAASKLGLECHIQVEHRVDNVSTEYRCSGNRLLTGLFGSHIHDYCGGEDEKGADRAVHLVADRLEKQGRKPYVIPLAPTKEPKGALGYVLAAGELIQQTDDRGLAPDLVVVGSGSGLTHAGLLFGLRLHGSGLPVLGACVRRNRELQASRVLGHCSHLSTMMNLPKLVEKKDVWVDDCALAPGYGKASRIVTSAVHLAATREGLLTDPVYSGKALGCLLHMVKAGKLARHKEIIFVHTGGAPALFAYRTDVEEYGVK
ncbi:MAG: D-cysteine desulfhydrase family protein [Gammaproteobacteria bacterium]|nr:D-cysteine desulfhydrase family protein [Gammaproteobacteria bacterium]